MFTEEMPVGANIDGDSQWRHANETLITSTLQKQSELLIAPFLKCLGYITDFRMTKWW